MNDSQSMNHNQKNHFLPPTGVTVDLTIDMQKESLDEFKRFESLK